MERKLPEWTPEWFEKSMEFAENYGWKKVREEVGSVMQIFVYQRNEKEVSFAIVDIRTCMEIQIDIDKKSALTFSPPDEYYNTNGLKINDKTFVGRIKFLLQ